VVVSVPLKVTILIRTLGSVLLAVDLVLFDVGAVLAAPFALRMLVIVTFVKVP
jgi:hypothetical protein